MTSRQDKLQQLLSRVQNKSAKALQSRQEAASSLLIAKPDPFGSTTDDSARRQADHERQVGAQQGTFAEDRDEILFDEPVLLGENTVRDETSPAVIDEAPMIDLQRETIPQDVSVPSVPKVRHDDFDDRMIEPTLPKFAVDPQVASSRPKPASTFIADDEVQLDQAAMNQATTSSAHKPLVGFSPHPVLAAPIQPPSGPIANTVHKAVPNAASTFSDLVSRTLRLRP